MCCCRCVCCRRNSWSERDENREWCERLFREYQNSQDAVESDDDFNGNLNDNFSDNFRDNIIIIINDSFNNSFNNNTL